MTSPDVEALLKEVRAAREGRDRWRRVGPYLRALRAEGVSYSRIRQATGVSRATAARLSRTTRREPSTTDR